MNTTTARNTLATVRRHGGLVAAVGFCALAVAAVAGQPGALKPQPIEPVIDAFVTVMPHGTMGAVNMTAYQRSEAASLNPGERTTDYAMACADAR